MQRIVNLVMQQRRQSFAAADSQCLGRQALQNVLGVVRTAKEGAVQSGPHPPMHLGRARDQQYSEGRAHRNGGFRSRGEKAGERTRAPRRPPPRRCTWVAPEISSTPKVAPTGMAAFDPAEKRRENACASQKVAPTETARIRKTNPRSTDRKST